MFVKIIVVRASFGEVALQYHFASDETRRQTPLRRRSEKTSTAALPLQGVTKERIQEVLLETGSVQGQSMLLTPVYEIRPDLK